MALVVNIARQLKLHFLLAALFVVGFAALPNVHGLFRVGAIDRTLASCWRISMRVTGSDITPSVPSSAMNSC